MNDNILNIEHIIILNKVGIKVMHNLTHSNIFFLYKGDNKNISVFTIYLCPSDKEHFTSSESHDIRVNVIYYE